VWKAVSENNELCVVKIEVDVEEGQIQRDQYFLKLLNSQDFKGVPTLCEEGIFDSRPYSVLKPYGEPLSHLTYYSVFEAPAIREVRRLLQSSYYTLLNFFRWDDR